MGRQRDKLLAEIAASDFSLPLHHGAGKNAPPPPTSPSALRRRAGEMETTGRGHPDACPIVMARAAVEKYATLPPWGSIAFEGWTLEQLTAHGHAHRYLLAEYDAAVDRGCWCHRWVDRIDLAKMGPGYYAGGARP